MRDPEEGLTKKWVSLFEKSPDGELKVDAKNIKELRKVAGIKQGELAKMTGLTQAYLSEVEYGKKILTLKSAKKIASVFNRLIKEAGKLEYQIDEASLWAGHIASFYPEKIRTRLAELLIDIIRKQKESEYLMEHKDVAPRPIGNEDKITDEETIMSVLKQRRESILANKNIFLKEDLKDDTDLWHYKLFKDVF